MSASAEKIPFKYAEYALLPADGRWYELIDGDFYVNASPTTLHQTVSRRLKYALMNALETLGLAAVFNAPTDVILRDTSVVQPDLAIVSEKHRDLVSERAIEGAPDLIVEILSSNRSHDEVLKRALYARHGVAEYWLVDPRAFTVELLRLDGAAYVQHAFFRRADTLTSPSFDGRIKIPLEPVFAPNFPSVRSS